MRVFFLRDFFWLVFRFPIHALEQRTVQQHAGVHWRVEVPGHDVPCGFLSHHGQGEQARWGGQVGGGQVPLSGHHPNKHPSLAN